MHKAVVMQVAQVALCTDSKFLCTKVSKREREILFRWHQFVSPRQDFWLCTQSKIPQIHGCFCWQKESTDFRCNDLFSLVASLFIRSTCFVASSHLGWQDQGTFLCWHPFVYTWSRRPHYHLIRCLDLRNSKMQRELPSLWRNSDQEKPTLKDTMTRCPFGSGTLLAGHVKTMLFLLLNLWEKPSSGKVSLQTIHASNMSLTTWCMKGRSSNVMCSNKS